VSARLRSGGRGDPLSGAIAIVGMGAIYPGAGTAPEFWGNIRAGVDAITDVPPHRWDPELYYDPESYARAPHSDKFYCRRGGFIDERATFDPAAFGIAPAAVEGMEPDQLLALRTAAEAITDAGGQGRLPDPSRIGVVIGRAGYITPGIARLDQRLRTSHQLVSALRDLIPDLGEARLAAIREAFCERLGPDGPDTALGLVPNFAASRIANRFDFRGPAYTVDAACASSLLAVEHAVRVLRGGQCDAVLAGAVHHAHQATVWSVFSRLRALSPSQRIRPFDRDADGTLLSEGTGMVVLKRLADAQRAGDRIYAMVRGSGTSSDGRAASLMSPRADGQVLALERAWRDAGLDPREAGALGLIEAHGTATRIGDETELETLSRVFGPSGPPIGLGTVKSMIGHSMPASGIAGLIKVALALHEAVLPPTLHVREPHPALTGTRFRPVTEPADWEPVPGVPRRAVVNAFGFGGVNAHLVLEETPGSGRRSAARAESRASRSFACGIRQAPERVLTLAAADPEGLARLLAAPDDDLIGAAEVGPVGGAAGGACRIAVVAPTARRLELARTVVARGAPWRGDGDIWFSPAPLLPAGGRLAFLFPGFEPVFEPRVDDVARHVGLVAPELTGRTDLAGRAADVIAVGTVLAAALRELGIEPDVAAGHGLGEWTAMVVTGMCPPEAAESYPAALDRAARGTPGSSGSPGLPDVAYAALACGAERAAGAITDLDGVVVSHDNCPHQSVICGPPEGVREAVDRLWAEGVLGQELPFRSGFHTPRAAGHLGPVDEAFRALPIRRPDVPLWSATTVAPFPDDPDEVRALVVRHLLEPVRFTALIRGLYEEGVRAFVQVGPGSLSGFVTDSLGEREHLAIALNAPNRDGMAQLSRVTAALWAEGHAPMAGPGSVPGTLRLDLGTPLVRLDGVLPELRLEADVPVTARDGSPVLAEFDALLREAAAGARIVLAAASRTGTEAAGLETAGLEAAGLETAGLEVAGFEAAGTEAACTGAAGAEAGGDQST
jgi:acyl transferase domain-containing protein